MSCSELFTVKINLYFLPHYNSNNAYNPISLPSWSPLFEKSSAVFCFVFLFFFEFSMLALLGTSAIQPTRTAVFFLLTLTAVSTGSAVCSRLTDASILFALVSETILLAV